MRKTLLWFLHEVVSLGRLHEWRLEVPDASLPCRYAKNREKGLQDARPLRFTCACGASRPAVGGLP